MPKLGMQPIRKKELIDATISVIHEAGLSDVTLAAIAAKAGLSTSIVNHYFRSKQELLNATMSFLASSFLGEVALRVSSVKDPLERVYVIIDANFAPSQCTPEAISAWLWFWARVPTNDKFSEIERAADNHVVNELRKAMMEIVPRGEADDLAEAIMALMYGFWLRFALDPSKIDVETARRITRDLATARLRSYCPEKLCC